MYHNPNENARKEVKPMKTKHYYCQGRAITRERVVIVQQEEVKKNA